MMTLKRWFSIKTASSRMRYRMTAEKIVIAIAWSLPKRLVYWCSIRLMSSATVGRWSGQVVPDLTALDALKRWE